MLLDYHPSLFPAADVAPAPSRMPQLAGRRRRRRRVVAELESAWRVQTRVSAAMDASYAVRVRVRTASPAGRRTRVGAAMPLAYQTRRGNRMRVLSDLDLGFVTERDDVTVFGLLGTPMHDEDLLLA